MMTPNEIRASHAAGGDITYEYVGDQPGRSPYEYCITLTVYRRNESGSATLGASQTISINSTCFGQSSLTMSRVTPTNPAGDGGNQPANYDACIDINDPTFFNISEHTYQACVILPGKCADYKFSWSLCCRNSNITNLQNPSSENLYLESTLNNTIGPNTSGQFLNPAAKSFCINQAFTWSQAAAEPDNDSIYYRLGQPWDAANTPINYTAGFSIQQPMSTVSGFNLDASTGTFIFTPSQVEVDVLKILVDEYRYDSVFNVWLKIGTAIRELQVPVLSQCNALAQQGITVDTTITGPGGTSVPPVTMTLDSLRSTYDITRIGNDSTAGPGGYTTKMPSIPYDCFDSVVTIEFSTKLKCGTFSPNGSEFRIVGPDQKTRPVVGVNTNCGTDLLTDKVDLILHRPLDTNGTYLLYLKNGDDGDVLENECGFSINPFYAIMIVVENCPTLDYELLNVSVEGDRDIRIDWDVDPNSFSEKVFTSWQILRAPNDDQFLPHDNVSDVNARSYVDTTLRADNLVDVSAFQYAVQLKQNFEAKAPTNFIRSILLSQGTAADSTSTDMSWNPYDGWDTVSYEVERKFIDTSGTAGQWESVIGPQQGLLNYNFDWPDVGSNPEEAGVYVFRVKATEQHNLQNNPFISESNWIYLEFIAPEVIDPDDPEIAYVPNVITPNGDMQNDIFYLGTNSYSTVSISVYNRWGKLVYEDLQAPKENYLPGGKGWNGTDMNSGNVLADGTYFYVIRLEDEATGENEELKGQLNIFTNGTK